MIQNYPKTKKSIEFIIENFTPSSNVISIKNKIKIARCQKKLTKKKSDSALSTTMEWNEYMHENLIQASMYFD